MRSQSPTKTGSVERICGGDVLPEVVQVRSAPLHVSAHSPQPSRIAGAAAVLPRTPSTLQYTFPCARTNCDHSDT